MVEGVEHSCICVWGRECGSFGVRGLREAGVRIEGEVSCLMMLLSVTVLLLVSDNTPGASLFVLAMGHGSCDSAIGTESSRTRRVWVVLSVARVVMSLPNR